MLGPVDGEWCISYEEVKFYAGKQLPCMQRGTRKRLDSKTRAKDEIELVLKNTKSKREYLTYCMPIFVNATQLYEVRRSDTQCETFRACEET